MLHQNIYNVFIPKNKTYLFTNHNVFSRLIRRNALIKFSKFIIVHGTTAKVIVWWNVNASSNLIVKFFYASITDWILCTCAPTICFAHTC